ncbi:multidrug transporter subunit MdtN [Variovorax sp. J22P168]|uniref:multidrug transporter subunit MdtN n=1 Tax=Variovorax jilinensis TaxID=3053513 RepID=UPI002576B83C|nr:multidrug transporter subunit MdtN [Variovorax sp. J22P168]MDM0014930.1 multidrug transporter subunit MdtN [Variovorax sp. J22P168]
MSTPFSGAKRGLALVVGVVIIGAAVVLGWKALHRSALNPLSEDAVLGAPVVHVAASVPGRIISIDVAENALVRRGDLLFSIDPAVYRLRVEQAKAQLALAEAAQKTQGQTSSAEASNAAITNQQIDRARSNLKLATQTLARLQPLLPKGYVTEQQVDDAATAKRNAQISLDQAVKQSQAAESLVIGPGAANAQVAIARATLAIAEQELAHTQVRAPHDGRVGGLRVAAGEFVIPGQSVFTLIDTARWHASAFFRETELGDIEVGRCALVYVMSDRRQALKGKVEGIGWGVTSTDALEIPRNLPYVQKSLNWVRIAQRFPVRIHLIDPPENLMRIGASAVVVVQHDSDC